MNSKDEGSGETSSNSNYTTKRKAEWFDIDEKHNTNVYVSGLPPEKIDEEKFVDLMKKYGIIAKLPIHGSPYSIKLYKNEDGSYKGDARCRYVHKESVNLAIDLLDGSEYEGSIIHCKLAEFKLKGSYDPSKKLRVDPKAKLKQKKVIDKLLSWETKGPPDVKQKKVILKYMFTPEEIAREPELLIELKDEVEERCKELIGEPKRVDVYDKHPDGVIAITFVEPQQAHEFVNAMADEYYAGRKIEASLWDGKTNYKIKETDEESEERLERWKQDIQKSSDSKAIGAGGSPWAEPTQAPVNNQPEQAARRTKKRTGYLTELLFIYPGSFLGILGNLNAFRVVTLLILLSTDPRASPIPDKVSSGCDLSDLTTPDASPFLEPEDGCTPKL